MKELGRPWWILRDPKTRKWFHVLILKPKMWVCLEFCPRISWRGEFFGGTAHSLMYNTTLDFCTLILLRNVQWSRKKASVRNSFKSLLIIFKIVWGFFPPWTLFFKIASAFGLHRRWWWILFVSPFAYSCKIRRTEQVRIAFWQVSLFALFCFGLLAGFTFDVCGRLWVVMSCWVFCVE